MRHVPRCVLNEVAPTTLVAGPAPMPLAAAAALTSDDTREGLPYIKLLDISILISTSFYDNTSSIKIIDICTKTFFQPLLHDDGL